MDWKGPLLVFAVLFLMLVVISLAPQPGSSGQPVQAAGTESGEKHFGFEVAINDYSLVDNDEGKSVRGAVTASLGATNVDNATLQLLLLGGAPKSDVFIISDYPAASEKIQIVSALRSELGKYGMKPMDISLADALTKKGVVLVIGSDALPSELSSAKLLRLLDGNTVIFFGKPLDLSVDPSGSQSSNGNRIYEMLNLSRDGRGELSSRGGSGNPGISASGNATVLAYANGYLVLYDDPMDRRYGSEIASLILEEGWQSKRFVSSFLPQITNSPQAVPLTAYSPPAPPGQYYLRLIYEAHGNTSENAYGVRTTGQVGAEKPGAILRIPSIAGTNRSLDYSFELHDFLDDNETKSYDLHLEFIRDGKPVDRQDTKTITMKSISIEKGSVRPNIAAGSYVVRLVDQAGVIHAAAFTHVPEVKVRLIRIEDTTHVFQITLDGQPASVASGTLTVNGKESFPFRTDKNGHASFMFLLSPGIHSFTVDLNGEQSTAYFKKEGDDSTMMLFGVILLGGIFLVFVAVLRSKDQQKWAVRTHRRLPSRSKTLTVPYGVFLDVFKRTQSARAPGLPLTVSDMKLGLRKYVTYRGAPLFVTDSNIYRLLEGLCQNGRFLSFGGYYLPKEMGREKPVEYWVIRRRLADRFLEAGEELPVPSAPADFEIKGKLIHIWGNVDPEQVLSLCHRHRDQVLLFPDRQKKTDFLRMAGRHEPVWMELDLQMRHGRVDCLSVDEFLERRLNGNGKG